MKGNIVITGDMDKEHAGIPMVRCMKDLGRVIKE